MNEELQHSHSTSRWMIVAAGLSLTLVALVAYWNSFSCPFIFDGVSTTVKNPTIRSLWLAWSPPTSSGSTIGRPLVNYSFAVNYALGGLDVGGYHALSLAIHVLAGLALFGLVRRTLLLPSLADRFGPASLPLALAAALLWVVHPLATSAVTYVAQRSESMMALFYLLTLYCFVRSTQSGSPLIWNVSAVLACLAGMASKEVMVSAPLMVLLYDRTFIAGSFQEAWRRRRNFYRGLFATWLLLGYLVADAGDRGGGVASNGHVSWWSYVLTQFRAIVQYLRLAVWPHPLVFDYGQGILIKDTAAALPYIVVVLLLAAGAVFSLRRWPAIGFLGVCFFVLLAPSSSVIPMPTEVAAEHRVYLPLAVVMILFVLVCHVRAGAAGYGILVAAAVAYVALTIQRNNDYRSEESIWADTVAKVPDSWRPQLNYGNELLNQGRVDEAIDHYRQALKLQPDLSSAWNNLGNALLLKGQTNEAVSNFMAAIELLPMNAAAYSNMGANLLQRGYWEEAVTFCRRAYQIDPEDANVCNNLAWVLAVCPKESLRNGAEAVEAGQKAEQLTGGKNSLIIGTLAAAYAEAGRFPEAVAAAERALAMATNAGQIKTLRMHIGLYQSGRSYHLPEQTGAPAGP